MKFQTQLFLATVVLTGLTAVVAWFGSVGTRKTDGAMVEIELNAQAMRNHLEGDMMHDGLRADVMAAILDASTNQGEQKDSILKDVKEHSDWFNRALAANKKLPLKPQVKAAIEEVGPALNAYIASASAVSALAFQDVEKAKAALPAFEEKFGVLEEKNEAVSTFIETENEQAVKRAAPIAANSIRMLIGVTIASAIFGLAVMAWIAKRIQKGLQIASRAAQVARQDFVEEFESGISRLAAGDLTFQVPARLAPVLYPHADEIGEFTAEFNQMLSQLNRSADALEVARTDLNHLVGAVVRGADGVVETSQMLAQSARTNRSAAENLSASSEETTAASSTSLHTVQALQHSVGTVMNDLMVQSSTVLDTSATLAETAACLESVVESAQSMSDVTQQGRSALELTSDAIRSVEQRAHEAATQIQQLDQVGRQIGQIVTTIDGIAEQTNLLALNAAIEAARAGENGRGFAVVADEVRKLAEQSQVATQQIAQLVSAVLSSVEQSVAIIEQTNAEARRGGKEMLAMDEAFSAILSAIETVSLQIQEVHTANAKMLNVMDEAVSIAEKSRENADGQASRVLEERAGVLLEASSTVASACVQNAQLAEEVTASADEVENACHQLASLAAELQSTAARFTVQSSVSSAQAA